MLMSDSNGDKLGVRGGADMAECGPRLINMLFNLNLFLLLLLGLSSSSLYFR